jgi:hypothetical protein
MIGDEVSTPALDQRRAGLDQVRITLAQALALERLLR